MKRKKRSITLIEIMIVILLIGLIGGALAFNMRGSLDKGRAFTTQQNIAKLEDILMFEEAQNNYTLEDIQSNPLAVLNQSSLVKDPQALLIDGWKKPIVVSIKEGKIVATSQALNNYNNKINEQKK